MKTILMAMVPLCLAASSAMAQDDLLSELASGATDSISSASIEIETGGPDSLDIAGLTQDAGTDAKPGSEADEAIEACFRRFGYRGWGHGYGCYNYGYNSCWYNPCYYSYYCYRPVYYSCHPVCYSYWGCY
jgi:hypothetical protein